MSYQTVSYEVRIDKDQLLNLFLGQGDLTVTLEYQTIIIDNISRQVSSGEGDEEFHIVEVRGVSDDPDIMCVDGTGLLKPVTGSQAFSLTLELRLEDHFD